MHFELLTKKINNTLTKNEEEIFDAWYNESHKHRAFFNRVKDHQKKGLDISDIKLGWTQVMFKINKKRKRNSLYKYAASIAILITTGSLWFFGTTKQEPQRQIDTNVALESPIKIGTDKAILTLEDGSKIILEKGGKYETKQATSNGERLVYNQKENLDNKAIANNLLTIPRGGQFYLVLSDGTKVWVNSETQLKYPVAFAPNEAREVELIYGEAYFDVSPSTQHNGSHFIVHNKNQEVEVLGTEFNIKAYTDDTHISTTLVEGKVTVKNEHNSKKLTPGYQSILNSGSSVFGVSKVDVFEEVSWKDGLFSFKNMPLEDIMKVLSRWYDVDVIFENDKLRTLQFNGVFRKNLNINNILNIIKNTNEVNYSITNKTIIMK